MSAISEGEFSEFVDTTSGEYAEENIQAEDYSPQEALERSPLELERLPS
jgi:hypothetical protein